jgi:conjugal transfer pilus assembly protein TraW
MIRRTGLAVIALVLGVSSVQAKVIGTYGTTYRITERDALAEIEERARQVDWSKVLDKRKVENYQGPPDKASLPRAKRNRSFPVDMTYTTEIDVPDGKGGILYPKGYTFNPLDYVSYPKTLVIINGTDPDQVKWFAASEYDKRLDVTLLLTEGSFGAVSKRISRPLFYADRKIVERLKLKAVPSVIKQKGRLMEVTEVVLPGGKAKKATILLHDSMKGTP